MTPEEVESLFLLSGGRAAAGGQDNDEAALPEAEMERRVGRMHDVLLTAQQQWLSGSEVLDHLAEKLGDGSRDGE